MARRRRPSPSDQAQRRRARSNPARSAHAQSDAENRRYPTTVAVAELAVPDAVDRDQHLHSRRVRGRHRLPADHPRDNPLPRVGRAVRGGAGPRDAAGRAARRRAGRPIPRPHDRDPRRSGPRGGDRGGGRGAGHRLAIAAAAVHRGRAARRRASHQECGRDAADALGGTAGAADAGADPGRGQDERLRAGRARARRGALRDPRAGARDTVRFHRGLLPGRAHRRGPDQDAARPAQGRRGREQAGRCRGACWRASARSGISRCSGWPRC